MGHGDSWTDHSLDINIHLNTLFNLKKLPTALCLSQGNAIDVKFE